MTNFCISAAEVLIPRHNNTTTPERATKRRNRVRVRKLNIALEGGSRALADFQVTPPLGRSIVEKKDAGGVQLCSTTVNVELGKAEERGWIGLQATVKSIEVS